MLSDWKSYDCEDFSWREDGTVEDFVHLLHAYLNRWVRIRTKPKCWAGFILSHEDPMTIFNDFNGIIHVEDFFFDWRKEMVQVFAKEHRLRFIRCSNCNTFFVKEWAPRHCPCREKRAVFRTPTHQNFQDYLIDLVEDGGRMEGMEEVMWEVLWRKGFPIYKTMMNGSEDVALAEIQALLDQFKLSRAVRLLWVTAALELFQKYEKLMDDHESGVFSLFKGVANLGIEGVFSRQAVLEYLHQG